jgi:uncharacterized protein (DUF58 family)
MKRVFSAEGVTEWKPGPHLDRVTKRFGQSGAVMLLLDVSASMKARSAGRTHLDIAVDGCRGFIDDAIDGGYHAGLLLWGHDVQAHVIPSENGNTAQALLNLADQYSGGTNVVPALQLAGKLLLDLDVADRVIAVFGDGDLGNATAAKACATQLASQGIRIVTLGLGDASARALAEIATETVDGVQKGTTSSTMSADIQGLARGLMGRRRRQ